MTVLFSYDDMKYGEMHALEKARDRRNCSWLRNQLLRLR